MMDCIRKTHSLFSYDAVSEFFNVFNKLADSIRQLWKGATKPGAHKNDYLRQILTNLAYRRAIPNPEVLNKHYQAFTSQVHFIQEATPSHLLLFTDVRRDNVRSRRCHY